MAHFCWFIKLLFLLLMMSKPPTRDARPLRGTEESSDLIAGNEFLKLFLGRDELHRALRSSENPGRGGSGGVADAVMEDEESEAGSRHPGPGARSLDHKSRGSNAYTYASGTDSKQVVKLVTSGSKIVFLEEYDDDDAVVDAVARDIDLQKERRPPPVRQEQQRHQGDEVKVVAVSVSSSSKRSGHVRERPSAEPRGGNFPEKALLKHGSGSATTTTTPGRQWQPKPHFDHHKSQRPAVTTSSISPPTLTTVRFPPTPATTRTTTARVTTTTTTTTARATTTTKSKSLTKSTATATSTTTAPPSDFINRSHKSEFSIEEVEPLTMAQRPASFASSSASSSSGIGSFYDTDSENSASTNIQNVLAAPLVRTPPTPPADGNDDDDDASTPGTYRGGSRNATRINQAPPPASSARSRVTHADSHMPAASAPQTSTSTSSSSSSSSSSSTSVAAAAAAAGTEDKLLPFQTVIYHDTKEGHGPQSRSISYSSISQNVEDLQTWQRSGILAEAQRNVSESLKPVPRSAGAAAPAAAGGQSEPAKFYSMPAKMYSVPSKFYSEPAKVYSEPAKVYGQPEKFYSEPAKVYGQPAKFYSEPAKVYSQPAKVYGEPAKTYWPRPSGAGAGATAATTMTTTTTTTTTPRAITTSTTDFPLDGTTTPAAPFAPRRPAIVSRIAFGEAQTTTTPVDPETSHYHRQSPGPHQGSQHHHHHHHHHHQQHHHQQQHHPYHGNAPSQPRRILFNLDKLPYDLLNAPEQSPKNLLEPDSSKHGTPTSAGRQRPCWEPPSSASASSSSTSSTSQQQQQRRQQMQQQQHHSSLLDQHSNQNAKGLPNRDLVKCVSKYSHSSGGGAGGGSGGSSARRPPSSYTTEGSHIEELYSPTPEQNYEIEESVSVMTNGRAHGVQGVATTTTTAAPARSRTRGGGGGAGAGGGSISSSGLGLNPGSAAHFGTNANANADDADDAEEATEDNYDDEDDDDSGGRHHSHGSGGGGGNGEHGDDDDSKVAYVVEGRNYRKYRVEEKTDDGFIVGEYGVVDHNDGNLRGVRYTADSTINRSLIQKALLTFLKLK